MLSVGSVVRRAQLETTEYAPSATDTIMLLRSLSHTATQPWQHRQHRQQHASQKLVGDVQKAGVVMHCVTCDSSVLHT